MKGQARALQTGLAVMGQNCAFPATHLLLAGLARKYREAPVPAPERTALSIAGGTSRGACPSLGPAAPSVLSVLLRVFLSAFGFSFWLPSDN